MASASYFIIPCSLFDIFYPGLKSRPMNRTMNVVRRNRRCHEIPLLVTKKIDGNPDCLWLKNAGSRNIFNRIIRVAAYL